MESLNLPNNLNLPTNPALLNMAQPAHSELLSGLLSETPSVSPKYLYDKLGSKLFDSICEVDEYYLTRTEASILEKSLNEIATLAGPECTLIDLGAGNCLKAKSLFSALRPSQYVPIDISTDFLKDSVKTLKDQFPEIDIQEIGMDFSNELQLPPTVRTNNRLFFYPGSSIGNFTPEQASGLLRRIREACDPDGGLLIGVDLVKDKSILEAAYNDTLGLTAAFNLNLLQNLNSILGSDFDINEWHHIATFNEEQSRIEMHLEALKDITVQLPTGKRLFQKGTRIHTENSYKYTQENFLDLLHESGFSLVSAWLDHNSWFMVCHAKAGPPMVWN